MKLLINLLKLVELGRLITVTLQLGLRVYFLLVMLLNNPSLLPNRYGTAATDNMTRAAPSSAEFADRLLGRWRLL